MRIIIISLTLITFLNCKGSPLSVKEPPDYGLGWNFIFWYIIDPELKRKEQCSKPNAIGYNYLDNQNNKIYCLSNNVSQGLVYDANTNIAITTDTLSPGQSFYCKCSPEFNGGWWYRGNIVEDNPPPGVSLTFIQYNKIGSNTPLVYSTNYNSTDNLYCVSQCSVSDTSTRRYQFLKIR